jgi:hypothetical protein
VNRIRTWWLNRRHQEAYAIWDAIRRDEQRRRQERADSTGGVRLAAERAPQTVDSIRKQAQQPDAVALRRDRLLCATGQMTIARFKDLHPELFLEESSVLTVPPEPVRPEPRFCHHPGAVTEFRVPAPGFRKRRTATGYRLRRNRPDPGAGYFVRRCLDCPASSAWVPVGSSMELTLPPWPIPTTGETPPGCNGGA